MTLTVASLFDGISGFCLAFERAGADVVATVEIDPAAASIGARHFPHAAQFPDVTKVTADDLRSAGFVPERGVVTFGWPCQDFSVAGRRAGLAGARSGLWWEVVRILADLRPRWIIGENVPGLLSSVCQCPGDDTCVLNGRADECGDWFTVKPGVNVSSDRFRTVKRSRQVWVAHAIHIPKGGACVGGCMETHGGAMGSVFGSLGQLGYGYAYRVLDAQYFGVPQQRRRVFIVGHLGAPFGAPAQVLLEPEGGGGDFASGGSAGSGVTRVTPISAGDVSGTVTAKSANGTGGRAGDERQNLFVGTGNDTHTHKSLDLAGWREARLPDRHRVSGGWTPHRQREVVSALTSNGVGTCGPDDNQEDDRNLVAFHATQDPISSIGRTQAMGTTQGSMAVATETVVRRLTELECERLQGYPDEWTEGQSGSARYRQLGNSLAVPVVEWIARRVIAVHKSCLDQETLIGYESEDV